MEPHVTCHQIYIRYALSPCRSGDL